MRNLLAGLLAAGALSFALGGVALADADPTVHQIYEAASSCAITPIAPRRTTFNRSSMPEKASLVSRARSSSVRSNSSRVCPRRIRARLPSSNLSLGSLVRVNRPPVGPERRALIFPGPQW